MCWCRFRRQVPEGSGEFRRAGVGSEASSGLFRKVCAGVGSGGKFRRVPVRFGVGSGGRFRKVPEGSCVCWFRFWRLVPEGWRVSACLCRFRRQVPEGSGVRV